MGDDLDNQPRGRWLLLLSVLAAVVSFAVLAAVLVIANDRRHRTATDPPPAVDGIVEAFLRKYANDPSSVSVQEIRYGPRHKSDEGQMLQLVFVGYRDRNRFGAVTYKETILRIEDGSSIHSDHFTESLLSQAGSMQWSTSPRGP